VIGCKLSNLFKVRSHRGTANRERNGIDVLTWEMGKTEPLGNGDSNGPIVPIQGDSYGTKRVIANNIKAQKRGHVPHRKTLYTYEVTGE
jgi:hypothetical protein